MTKPNIPLIRHTGSFPTMFCLHLKTSWPVVHVLGCSVVPDSLWTYGLWPARLLCPWHSPGKNTRVGCHALLQGIELGIEPKSLMSPVLQADSLPAEPSGKPHLGLLVSTKSQKKGLTLCIIYQLDKFLTVFGSQCSHLYNRIMSRSVDTTVITEDSVHLTPTWCLAHGR